MIDMIDNLRGMGVFATVIRHGSFSRAAKELGVTPSAISQQIRMLELSLGVNLINRSTRQLSLTDAGESLYKSSIQMLKTAEVGYGSVVQLKEELTGVLRVATNELTLANQFILPALRSGLPKDNNLILSVFCSADFKMIEDRIDVAIVFNNGEEGVSLATLNQVVVTSPSYLEKHGSPSRPKDLLSHDIILVGDKTMESFDFKNKRGQRGVKVASQLITNNADVAINMAVNGQGILKTNSLMVRELLEQGRLVTVLGEYTLPKVHISALTSSKEPMLAKTKKSLQALQDYMVQQRDLI